MALSNKERVGRILDELRNGLVPFVVREYRKTYRNETSRKLQEVLNTNAYQLPREALKDVETLQNHLDTHAVLNLMWRCWKDVFQEKLGHSGRSYVSELMEARNHWAHTSDSDSGIPASVIGQRIKRAGFTNDEAYRIADTATRLLEMVSASQQAENVKQMGKELLRIRYEEEAKKAKTKATVTATAVAAEAPTSPAQLQGLLPWRHVITPHADVTHGNYLQAEFAADLAQVVAGTAVAEYQDPKEFFRRTYLTEGLVNLLATGINRLVAKSADPVIQLQTAFGGGKTHSMLALYHIVSGNINLSDIPQGDRIHELIGDVDLPEAQRAVLVGTALDPAQPRIYPDATVHTLWGELAYQLGGAEGYAMVATADQKGVSPNSNTLADLLYKFGPCLIIIDEFVAYARNIYHVDGLSSGTFDSVMTFAQALTEAVRRSQESLLLISLPESGTEVGGEAGHEALNRLGHIVGRMESVWKPVSATESFEIVRRRLFTGEINHAARDAVLNAFGDLYRNATNEFPSGVNERDYQERMKAAYPIHPELFDRLYQDWSTLDRFQRTRGVLRLMAAIIHKMWRGNDSSLLIMPGTLPLAETAVRNELLRYLPDAWAAIFDKDVNGPESLPAKIDGDVPALGRLMAAQRVARTIFMGSAPSVGGQTIRGLEDTRIRLGCTQPFETVAVYGDALRRMSSQLSYLYNDGSRYWYDTRPTVNRIAQDRMSGFTEEDVNGSIVAELRKVPKNKRFGAFHVAPQESSDVADEAKARLVLLPPSKTHKKGFEGSEAMKLAEEILHGRGNSQRLYKNMLLFVAADEADMQALQTAVRESKAWASIQQEEEQLNLDAQQRRQVKESLLKATETIGLRLHEAYSWLLIPEQPEALGKIKFQAKRIGSENNIYDKAADHLQKNGQLIEHWSPDSLRLELESYIWGEGKGWQVGLKQLWEYLAQYCYLPRLSGQEVLLTAVREGVSRADAPLAYATGLSADGYHTGVVYRTSGAIYFDEQSLLVHPAHLRLRPTEVVQEAETAVREGGEVVGDGLATAVAPAAPKRPTRYYGRVELDAQRINKKMGEITEEVIEWLSKLPGAEVKISVEIEASWPPGFDEATVRTVSENSKTLKFKLSGFEQG